MATPKSLPLILFLTLFGCSCQSRLIFPANLATNRLTPLEAQTLAPKPSQIPLAQSFGWLFRSIMPDRAVMIFHGNAETVDDYASWATRLANRGLTVLLVEYPGYRDSPGKPNQDSIRRAATAGFDWLQTLGFRNDEIVVCGRSIGAAAACDLTEHRDVKNLILISPFTSLGEMARANKLPKVLALGRFDNLSAIQKYTGDLLIIHGRQDRILPFNMGTKLFMEAATSEKNKAFLPLDAGHNDLLSRHQATVSDRILTMR